MRRLREILKYKFLPSIWGTLACLLLLLTRILENAASPFLQAVNAVALVAVLGICIHFVRGTAQLDDRHVWELPSLVILICMPAFNLIATALQLLAPGSGFLSSPLFAVPLIFFSLPAFFCYYFIYVARRLRRHISVVISTGVLCAVGAVYVAFRLIERVILPLWGGSSPALMQVAGSGSALSIAIYALSIVCFAILSAVFGAEIRAAEKANAAD